MYETSMYYVCSPCIHIYMRCMYNIFLRDVCFAKNNSHEFALKWAPMLDRRKYMCKTNAARMEY